MEWYSSSSVIAVWSLKTWRERAAHVVREDAAHRVRVADVHVAVDEARRDDEVARVDHPVGADAGEVGGLADLADAAALDEDRGVLDDPPVVVER